MSRVQLATATNATRKHVMCIENQKTVPSIEYLLRLRAALGCSLDDIFPDPDLVYPQRLRGKIAVSA